MILGVREVVNEEVNQAIDTKHPRYIKAYTNAVKALIPYNIPFEINTGAISRGYRTEPYPDKALTDYIKQKGGTLLLSSDAHSAENLSFRFDDFENML